MAMLLAKDVSKIPYSMFEIVSKTIKYIIRDLLEDGFDEKDVDFINLINIAAIYTCQQANIMNLFITNVGDEPPSKLEINNSAVYSEEDIVKIINNYIDKAEKEELITQLVKVISKEVSSDQDVLTSATQFVFYLTKINDESLEHEDPEHNKVQSKLALANLIKLCTRLNKKESLKTVLKLLDINIDEFILDNFDLLIN